MAEFVRAQIFGTTFEITSRCASSRNVAAARSKHTDGAIDILTFNRSAWEPLGLSGEHIGCYDRCNGILTTIAQLGEGSTHRPAVAVKKIMKPFSTPVLSKRTYRELKLLKHLEA